MVKNLPAMQEAICSAGDPLQCRRLRFEPWVGKIPWRRAWQLTPVFLLGKFHGEKNLVGYSPWGSKELDTTEGLSMHTHVSLQGLHHEP